LTIFSHFWIVLLNNTSSGTLPLSKKLCVGNRGLRFLSQLAHPARTKAQISRTPRTSPPSAMPSHARAKNVDYDEDDLYSDDYEEETGDGMI